MRAGPDITICDACYTRIPVEHRPGAEVEIDGVTMHVCDPLCKVNARLAREKQLTIKTTTINAKKDAAKKLGLKLTSKKPIDLEKRHGW